MRGGLGPRSLRLGLAASLLVVSVAALGIFGAFAFWHARRALDDRVRANLAAIALLKRSQIEEWVQQRLGDVLRLAYVPGFGNQAQAALPGAAYRPSAAREIRQALDRIRSAGDFAELFLLDPLDGRVALSTDQAQEGRYKDDRPYFREGRKAPFVQPAYYSPAHGRPAMAFSAPVWSRQGRLVAVLVGRADLRFLDRVMAEAAGLGETGATFLVNRFNYAVTDDLGQGGESLRLVFSEGVRRGLAGEVGTARYENHKGREVVGAHVWIPGLATVLLAEMDAAEALAPAIWFRTRLLTALAIVSALAMLLGAVLSYRITRPLMRLADAARALGRGDLTHRVAPDGPEELAAVASAVNAMADALLASRREREAHSERLESEVARRTRELGEAQEQLRQAQKLEAVGRLAGGIAHDFNNLLTAIGGYGSLLLASLPEPDPRRTDVEQISQAAARAAALTRQLLAFSRRQVLQPSVLDLNAVVTDIDRLLRRLIGENVEIVTRLDPELGCVRADRAQLDQVLVNLAVNARDAMPGGGKLILETANVELDQAYARAHAGARPGPHVMLAVSDTGCGMDPETMSHVFEPFFTTKEVGKGTGLGLATVYGVVKQSGGNVWVYSEPGRGASFKIYLPRVDEAPDAPAPLPVSPARGGRETILLAEDDPGVRSLAREVLARKGYTVLEASDGAEAERLSARHPGPIALLLTDLVMPGIGGRELARRLAGRRERLRCLYMSGYTDAAAYEQAVFGPGETFVSKPFTAEALLDRVREVLDRPAGA